MCDQALGKPCLLTHSSNILPVDSESFSLYANKKLVLLNLPTPIADGFQYTAKFYAEMDNYNTRITERKIRNSVPFLSPSTFPFCLHCFLFFSSSTFKFFFRQYKKK